MSSLPLDAADAATDPIAFPENADTDVAFAVPAGPPPCLRTDESAPILEIPADLPFEALRLWTRETMPACTAAIGGRSLRLDLGAREIQLFDLRRLIHLIRDEFQIEVTGLYVRPAAIHRYAERELKLKLFTAPEPPPAPEPTPAPAAVAAPPAEPAPSALDKLELPHDLQPADLEPEPSAADLEELAFEAPRRQAPESGARTLTVHRTLRSGAVVRFDGDVIVFGDVNPGANIIATGNVVVLGALKGMAHAGAQGDESTTILAFDFRPTQVRIGRKIAMPPTAHKAVPELVVVRDGDIVVEPYRGRFR